MVVRSTIGAVLFLSALVTDSPTRFHQASSIRHVRIVATDYAYQVPAV